MKYQGSIEISRSRQDVVSYFADPNYLGEYQDGFIRKELVSGEQGQDGAVSRMYYRYGNRQMVHPGPLHSLLASSFANRQR